MLKVLALEGLLKGKSVAVDATTLEANSIVRRDTGEDYDATWFRDADTQVAKLDKNFTTRMIRTALPR